MHMLQSTITDEHRREIGRILSRVMHLIIQIRDRSLEQEYPVVACVRLIPQERDKHRRNLTTNAFLWITTYILHCLRRCCWCKEHALEDN